MNDERDVELNVNDDNNSNQENKSTISSDLIRGHINTIILRTLNERDKYGYEIIEDIESKSHGQYTLKQPTLYSALKRLENQGYITAYWKNDDISAGGRRKYYTLTENGKEIAEKNQSEWEYSRTIIDNLISDRNFDFSQPAPTPVDFNILKKSTSRVPVIKNEEEFELPPEPLNTKAEQPVIPPIQEERAETIHEAEERIILSNEQRQLQHENYIKLVSEPTPPETPLTPYADSTDTDKYIYINRPEAERDYRNILNKLFVKTVKSSPQQMPQQANYQTHPPVSTENISFSPINDAVVKAQSEGLNVGTSNYSVKNTNRKYNRGKTLFKCSSFVSVILLFVFAMTLIFREPLGISFTYPFVILAIAAVNELVFYVFYLSDRGKVMRKPTSLTYLSACFVITVIAIAIVIISGILIGTTFTNPAEMMANIIIPCIVALCIPIFACLFYVFSR